ncbi:hypothetical protein C1I92_25905, partial [Jiangella anatolica]
MAGVLAGRLDGAGPVTVTLRTPPPLETPLAVTRSDDGLSLLDGDTLVAVAAPGSDADLVAVPPVPVVDVAAISARYPGFSAHPFPECFV